MKAMWNNFWRVLRVLPVCGVFVVLALAPETCRRKGYALGTLVILLDMLPVICVIKAFIELFTGDLIPDKLASAQPQQLEVAAQ
jgi:hypothetical protein